MRVVVEDPGLYGTVVTILHCGAEGTVLQTADGQTWLGDDVEEGVLLWRGEPGVKGTDGSEGKSGESSVIFKLIHLFLTANFSTLIRGDFSVNSNRKGVLFI